MLTIGWNVGPAKFEIVSFDTFPPYTSSKWAAISPVVSPRADNDKDDLVDSVEAPFPHRHDDRCELAVPV